MKKQPPTPKAEKGTTCGVLQPKIGRPGMYSEQLADTICNRIALGESLRKICADEDMPSASSFCAWTLTSSTIAEQYARAREARADARADRIDDYVQQMLTGAIDPQQCRVAIDAEKWQAGKENPKRYGDKIEQVHSGAIELKQLPDEHIDERLAMLKAKEVSSS